MLHGIDERNAARIRNGQIVELDGIAHGGIDIVLNRFSTAEILAQLAGLKDRDTIKVMIHEQYFYEDYPRYQPDFEEKLAATFACLTEQGYRSAFLEDLI